MSCKKMACKFPFSVAEIDWDGNVYGCCAGYFINYSLGNIFEQSFDEIWNGQKAQEFRKQFLEDNFKFCDFTKCAKEWEEFTPELIAPYPKRVQLNYDSTCNARCIYCRQHHFHNDVEKFDEHMEDIILPILKNAELVNVTALGEVFASKYAKKLIHKIVATYPNIKFYVYTNGIECSKEKIEEFGLTDRIKYIVLSMPGLKKETYDKHVVDGNYDKVVNNIKYLGELRRQNKLDNFILNFVVTSYNYPEMIDFVDFAKENSATVSFVKLLKQDGSAYIYDDIAVAEKTHPLHEDYLKVIHNEKFKEPHVNKTNTFTIENLQ